MEAFPKRRVLEKERFFEAVKIFQDNLGIAGLRQEIVEESLTPLLGTAPTPETWKETAHRLAGNAVRLRNHRVVLPWNLQRFDEWVPAQIMRMRYERGGRGKMGVTFTFKILAGTPCPKLIFQFWSLKKCRYLSTRFGFERWRGREPPKHFYESPKQFVTLRALLLIDSGLSEREPYATEIEFPPSLEDWNKRQIHRRTRLDFKCPQDYPRTLKCHDCPIGYQNCPAGTHPQDYSIEPCPRCGEQEAFFDADLPDTMCLDCQIKHAYSDS